ncbi:MAG: hypothetical protein L6Q53_17895 [Candidatus Brocadia sinica]|nr:hypothetical protein [Candidatus Brocadia sinica]NUO06964.1 hypothetical protein [Candidatus Brocadia sinica]
MIYSSRLNFMEGERFHHVFSTTIDKGKAVRMLINIYKNNFTDSIKTIGLDDSLIDLPMLATVDIPILVKKASENYGKRIQLPNLIYTDGIGPEGWNRAILKIFKNMISIVLICISLIKPASAEPISGHNVHYIIDNSTITRIQKPLVIRTDRETLEYFMEHVEELTRHGKDFRKKELLLEVKGNGRYGIHMPAKHITGEFELAEQKPQKVIYMGHGNAAIFFNFSGSVALEIDYTTQNYPRGPYENVKTAVHLKFDNAFLAFLAKAASPVLVPKLDKLISKLATKTKNVVETAYANKKSTK